MVAGLNKSACVFLFFIIATACYNCNAQDFKDTFIIEDNVAYKNKVVFLWGDTLFMNYPLESGHHFLLEGLNDGLYVAFYDSLLKKKAFEALVKDGVMQGTFKYWEESGDLIEISQYDKGLINGYRKLYLRLNGKMYMNIYLYDYGIRGPAINEEW